MRSQPVTTKIIDGTSTPAKRTLFRIALAVAIVGTGALTTILILHGGLALARLRYFVDVGIHPLHITSAVLLLGILSLSTLILLTYSVSKTNRVLATIAAVLLGICSLTLIVFTIWSFVTIANGQLSSSINSTISKELDKTEFTTSTGNSIIVRNTAKMARLEKQHQCCGFAEPVEDYRSRQQQSAFGSLNPSSSSSSSSGGSSGRGRGSATQRTTASFGSAVQLPISCCNEKYRSADDLCIDVFANNTSPINRYNNDGCYRRVAQYKYERIQKQGFTTVVAACIGVISCIALAAVVRLMGEGYQIVPLRTAM